jgi:hypothetical protein
MIFNGEKLPMRTLRARVLLLAIVVLGWLGLPQGAHAGFVYVVAHNTADHLGSGDVFGTLDVSTGTFTQISPLSTANQTVVGMGFGPDGQLYGLGLKSLPALTTDLFRIDVTTGTATDLGPSNFQAAGAGSGSNGVLFGIDVNNNNLYAVTPPAPTGSFIATLPFIADGLVAIRPDGHLFAAGNGDGSFFRVETTTGASTLVGNTGQGINLFAGSFVGSTLYGFNGSNNAILTIDPTTAAATQVATTALPSGYAVFASAAPLAVPEPASLALGIIGGLTVLTCSLRGRRKRARD